MVVDWEVPLQHRRGGPTRLGGLDIYYDFEWSELFPNGRAQFKNGQCLARLIREDCPEGKIPALLLTTRNVDEGPIETDSHFVVVLNLPRYRATATPDAAASYYAHRLDSGITGIAKLRQLASQPDVIGAVVERQLDAGHIADWASIAPSRMEDLRRITRVDSGREKADEPEMNVDRIAAWASDHIDRIEQLRSIAGVSESKVETADIQTAVAALQALDGLDRETTAAIEDLLRRDVDKDVRLRLLRVLTEDPAGRYVTTAVLGERINERLADARNVTHEYSALLADSASTETDLQRFIEQNPWLLGLDYVHVRPRWPIPRGQADFVLERHDGVHDFLELKSPQDPIIAAPAAVNGVPPPANAYALSAHLAQALAQVHVYRENVTADPGSLQRLYGLPNARDPRVIIVIGQVASLADHRARVLREVNLSLHRVEIVPYDVIAARAETILDNVQRHLTAL
jgi:hypothetical protein